MVRARAFSTTRLAVSVVELCDAVQQDNTILCVRRTPPTGKLTSVLYVGNRAWRARS